MTRVTRASTAAALVVAAGLAVAPASVAADRRPQLVARAVLPAGTLGPGPVSGTAIGAGPFNGRTSPFAGLSLSNPRLVGGASSPQTVGLGDPLAFPFQTIESLLVEGRRSLIAANDDDFPFSSGRRPGAPDDNEIIEVRLPRPLTGSR